MSEERELPNLEPQIWAMMQNSLPDWGFLASQMRPTELGAMSAQRLADLRPWYPNEYEKRKAKWQWRVDILPVRAEPDVC